VKRLVHPLGIIRGNDREPRKTSYKQKKVSQYKEKYQPNEWQTSSSKS